MYDKFQNLSSDWTKTNWAIAFGVLFVAFFKYSYNSFFFYSHPEIFHILSIFLKIVKRGSIIALSDIFDM